MLKFVDLFAGIGGFHHALAAPPFDAECVMAVELDPDCRKVYAASFLGSEKEQKTFPFITDIRTLTINPNTNKPLPLEQLAKLIPDHNILCGGFPCQPFSKSGHQAGSKDDTRGTLFFDIMRIIKAKEPKYVILENVPNLAGPRHHESTWLVIIQQLREAGYLVSDRPCILSPHELPPDLGGTPQVRKRLFILATLDDNRSKQPTENLRDHLGRVGIYPPGNWSISDYLVRDSANKGHLLRDDEKMWLKAWQHFVQMIPDDNLPGFPIWERALRKTIDAPEDCPPWKLEILRKNRQFYIQHRAPIDEWRTINWSNGVPRETIRIKDFPESRRKFEWQARSCQPTRLDRNIYRLLIQFRPSGIRVKPPTYAPALVAINQTTILGRPLRRITAQEAARLQGFPTSIFDKVSIAENVKYKQLGNAVPVGIVKFCMQWLLDTSH